MTDNRYQPADGEECAVSIRATWNDTVGCWAAVNCNGMTFEVNVEQVLSVAALSVEEPTEFGARAWVTVEGWRYVPVVRVGSARSRNRFPCVYELNGLAGVNAWSAFKNPTLRDPDRAPEPLTDATTSSGDDL